MKIYGYRQIFSWFFKVNFIYFISTLTTNFTQKISSNSTKRRDIKVTELEKNIQLKKDIYEKDFTQYNFCKNQMEKLEDQMLEIMEKIQELKNTQINFENDLEKLDIELKEVKIAPVHKFVLINFIIL